MNSATALHTRARCDECRDRLATHEGSGGVNLCDICAASPCAANDDVLGSILNAPRICSRCQIRPAMLRVDPNRILCSECWRQLDAKLSDFNSVPSAVPPPGVKVAATALMVNAPASAVAVTPLSVSRPSLATGMSGDQANGGGDHEAVAPLSIGSELCIFETVSGASPGACGSERDGFGALNSESQANATEGSAGTAGTTGPVRRSTAGTGLQVGEAVAVRPATSEFMDVTGGESAAHNFKSRACEGNGSNAGGSKTSDGSARYNSCGPDSSRDLTSSGIDDDNTLDGSHTVAAPRSRLAGLATSPQDSTPALPQGGSPVTVAAHVLGLAAAVTPIFDLETDALVSGLESGWLRDRKNSQTLRVVAASDSAPNDGASS